VPSFEPVEVVGAVDVVDAGPEHRALLEQLFELYQYDFTEFDGEDVDETGRFGFPSLGRYFVEPQRHPFLLRVDGHWAGCALVIADDGNGRNDMAEFFVLRKYRRNGIGRWFARELFARFPGTWQVRQLEANTPAQAFWRHTIPVPFEESSWARGPMQVFTV
jgi:predicted acetyltransferase